MIRRKSINRTILAVGAAAVLVGGTLAWFTSTDKVTNSFKAGGNGSDHGETTGVEIWEVFDKTAAGKVLPGTIINKDVQVQNTATYNSLIRVKLTPKITSAIDGSAEVKPTTDKIHLIFGDNVIRLGGSTEGNTDGKWLEWEDGYYYYLGKVAPNGYTARLLDNVQLLPNAGNEFKGVDFDVVVDAESVQSDNGAYKDAWKISNENLIAELEKVLEKTAGTASQIPGAGK